MPRWIAPSNDLPPLGVPALCLLRHCSTENVEEHLLIRVKEDDVSWRTADDHSEVSFDWDVIGWRLKDPQGGVVMDAFKKLRDDWTMRARLREETHGDDDEVAKALRKCAGELHAAIRDGQG